MTYTPTIYDWRDEVTPLNMLFRAGGASVAGGMTLGGMSVSNPEPGGRGELQMEFSPFASEATNIAASWTISRIMNGAVMRIPLPYNHVQIITDSALGITTSAGVLWSNGLPWSGGVTWRRDTQATINAAANAGTVSLSVNMSGLGAVMKIGHVIGLYLDGHPFVHIVLDAYVAPNNNYTVIEIAPPLRRNIATTDRVNFRPIFQCTCANAREVAALYRYGKHVQLNAARFVEALV